MNKSEAVMRWLIESPHIDSILNIDGGSEGRSFSLNSVPSGGTVEEYQDGSVLTQFDTVLDFVGFTAFDFQRVENLGLFEDLEEWVTAQDEDMNFPDIGGVQSVEVLGNAYLASKDASGATGMYQIQLRVIYLTGGK